MGESFRYTYEANPGEVWEEDEFWIELSWRIDPDGSLGIRSWFESPYAPGERLTVQEYYRWLFENAVPGLPEVAAREGLTPFEYMSQRGAFLIEDEVHELHAARVEVPAGAAVDPESGVVSANRKPIGVRIGDQTLAGFPTPSRRLEVFSKTLAEWGWPEQALPGYVKSHIHRSAMDASKGEFVLMPTFRLPTLIHT